MTAADSTGRRRWRIGAAIVCLGWLILLAVLVFGSESLLLFGLETLVMLFVVGMAVRAHRRDA